MKTLEHTNQVAHLCATKIYTCISNVLHLMSCAIQLLSVDPLNAFMNNTHGKHF